MDNINIDIQDSLTKMCVLARKAVSSLANLSNDKKNDLLMRVAGSIEKNRQNIREANNKDIECAEKLGKNKAFIDRLTLNDKRIDGMIKGLKEVVNLSDPVGRTLKDWERPNGLMISKVSVPIGVVGIIFESRPNVTCEAASLCFKSGNVVILKGGKESFESNLAIERCFEEALTSVGLPINCVKLVPFREREATSLLLKMDQFIDLIIPRGGESLIRFVSMNSSIPVIKHYKGVCHIYVDASADFDVAKKIILNAKIQRPAVCNAVETLLVHKDVARKFMPKIVKSLRNEDVTIRGCMKTLDMVDEEISLATDDDWYTEYLDLIISIKVVDSIDDAIAHITKYGSKHSDAIVSDDIASLDKFQKEVDSSAVFVNCSTRFNDGGEFGFGAEIGISTDKIHARGPMGLEELNIYKYIVKGSGQIRE